MCTCNITCILRLYYSGRIVSVDISSITFLHSLSSQVCKMKRQSGQWKIKNHKLDYLAIGTALRKFCNPSNNGDHSEEGTYGQAANYLKWSNSSKNRKV